VSRVARRLSLFAVSLVAAIATWLVTLDLGPWRAVLALTDPQYTGGAPLEAHHALRLGLPSGLTTDAVTALAAAIDARLTGVARVVDVRSDTIVVATLDVSDEARATVERALAPGHASFEVLRVLDDAPAAIALRRFVDASPIAGARAAPRDLVEADSRATLDALLALAATDCAPCRPAPDERFVLGRDDLLRDGAARERWTALLVSRAEPTLGDHSVAGAELATDDAGRVVVMIALSAEGERRIEALTSAWLDGRVAMMIDGLVHMAPVIRDVITRGPISLSIGGGSYAEDLETARDLVTRLRPGLDLPAGTTLGWSLVAGVDATALALALALTVALGALAALVLALALARLLRFEPAPATLVGAPPGLALWALAPRVAVTVAVALTPWALAQVPLPLVDPELDGATSLAMLGLIPVFLAHLLVSLVVTLVPRLRHLGRGDPATRRRLRPATALVTLALAALQALPLVLWMQQFDLELRDLVPGLVITSLAGGAFTLWGAAALASRFGIGNGFVVITASAGVEAVVAHARDGRFVLLGVALALAGALLAATCFRVRGDARTARRLPLAGLVPLELVTFALPIVLLVVALTGSTLAITIGAEALVAAIVLVGLALSWLFGRALPPARRLPASLVSVALLAAIALACEALRAPGLDLASLVTLVALPVALADLGSEALARARLGALATLTATHDVDEADRIADAVARAGVPVSLRAPRMRSLSRFMGPWLPVEVLVPDARAEAAGAALRAHTHADLLRPFEDER